MAAFTYSPAELDEKIKQYFFECEETRRVFPDEAGMLNFLAIDDEEYAEMKDVPEYKKSILWAKRRRTSWLERQMVSDNKAANGCMNALKQEKNGGYSEKQQDKKEKTIIVKFDGVTEIGGAKK